MKKNASSCRIEAANATEVEISRNILFSSRKTHLHCVNPPPIGRVDAIKDQAYQPFQRASQPLAVFMRRVKANFVSAGGGAMLEFLEGKELPGIKAILQ